MGFFFFTLYCSDFKHFHLNHPVCLFDPLEQWASTSGLADFQREASFSFTAGRKQFNTHKLSSGGENLEGWEGLCIYKEDTWQIIDDDKNRLPGPFQELVLKWGADLQSAGLGLTWHNLLTSVFRWSCLRQIFTSPLLLTGYRSVCFSSVWGSGEAFSVTGEEVEGL